MSDSNYYKSHHHRESIDEQEALLKHQRSRRQSWIRERLLPYNADDNSRYSLNPFTKCCCCLKTPVRQSVLIVLTVWIFLLILGFTKLFPMRPTGPESQVPGLSFNDSDRFMAMDFMGSYQNQAALLLYLMAYLGFHIVLVIPLGFFALLRRKLTMFRLFAAYFCYVDLLLTLINSALYTWLVLGPMRVPYVMHFGTCAARDMSQCLEQATLFQDNTRFLAYRIVLVIGLWLFLLPYHLYTGSLIMRYYLLLCRRKSISSIPRMQSFVGSQRPNRSTGSLQRPSRIAAPNRYKPSIQQQQHQSVHEPPTATTTATATRQTHSYSEVMKSSSNGQHQPSAVNTGTSGSTPEIQQSAPRDTTTRSPTQRMDDIDLNA